MNYFNAVRELVGGALSGPTLGPVSEFIFNDGQIPPTEEEIQKKLQELQNAEPMRRLREERNRRLMETDYLALKDVFMTTDEELYRQHLRDITKGAKPKLDENGNLTNVTWPTKPE
jgi:hypothetical protein